jgi:translation initiation factor IF-1
MHDVQELTEAERLALFCGRERKNTLKINNYDSVITVGVVE